MLVAYALLIGDIPLLFDTAKFIDPKHTTLPNTTIDIPSGPSEDDDPDYRRRDFQVKELSSANKKLVYYNPIETDPNPNKKLERLKNRLEKDKEYFDSYRINYVVGLEDIGFNEEIEYFKDTCDNLRKEVGKNENYKNNFKNIEKSILLFTNFEELIRITVNINKRFNGVSSTYAASTARIFEILKQVIQQGLDPTDQQQLATATQAATQATTQLEENYKLKKIIYCISVFKNLSSSQPTDNTQTTVSTSSNQNILLEQPSILAKIKYFFTKCFDCFKAINLLREKSKRITTILGTDEINFYIPFYI